jgi:CRISPR/Cas system CMR subunit Cmr6 (Cas7 group RAMP superfamily)
VAKNPNELAKIMEEMMRSLQQLSEEQLESVGGIVSSQKKAIVKQKRERKTKETLEKITKDVEKTKVKSAKKVIGDILKQKEDLVANFDKNIHELSTSFTRSKDKVISISSKMGSNLVDGLGLRGVFDAYDSSKKLLADPKQFLKDKIFGPQKPISNALTIKKDLVLSDAKLGKISLSNKGNIFLNSQKVSSGSSDSDFDAHKVDYDLEEYKLLKSIDGKMDKFKVTGESGGIFELISTAIQEIGDVVKSVAGDAALGGLGLGAGGLGAILAKAKKIPGAKALGTAGKMVVKNPGKAGLVAGGVALAGYGASQFLGDEVEARENGGRVEKGKPYLVGEAGPELVVPNHNGTVLPNDKISTNLTREQFSKLNLAQKNRSQSFVQDIKSGLESYFKPATISMNKYFKNYTEDYETYKTEIKDSILTVFDSLKKWWEDLKDVGRTVGDKAKTFVQEAKEKVNGTKIGKTVLDLLGMNNEQEQPKIEVDVPAQPTPSTTIPQPIVVNPPPQTIANDYRLPTTPQQTKPIEVIGFGEGFLEGFGAFFNPSKETTKETMSARLANPYGTP